MSEVKKIIPTTISSMVEEGMTVYGKTTIEQRAVPDFRDGLKPVQRRALYSMFAGNVLPNKGLKKSMAIVGDVLAKYHPHGDMAVFNAMVNIVQDRYPLIFGSGNWGDEYSPCAAPRYIDCRLTDLAMQFFEYINVAEFVDNYTGEFKEPVVLPCKIPALLMNGSSGIAVGVSVKIPPHNLKEVVDCLICLLKNPAATTKDLIQYLQGPDYRLGGVLLSSPKEIETLYEEGKGSLIYRCQYRFVELDGMSTLEVFNYAPEFAKDTFLKKCDKLVKKGLLEYINDDSADGIFKISIGFKSSSVIETKVLPLLKKTVSYQFYVTERHADRVTFKATNLREHLLDWLEYQREVKKDYLTRSLGVLRLELSKQKARLIATKEIDIIAQSLKSKQPAKFLVVKLGLSDQQAKYILDCKIGGLARISVREQVEKLTKLKTDIQAHKIKLSQIDTEIVNDLQALKSFFDERRTLIRQTVPAIPRQGKTWILLDSGAKNVRKIINETKAKHFRDVCAPESKFFVIDESGMSHCWKADMDMDKVKLYPNTISILSDKWSRFAAIDATGRCTVVDINKCPQRQFAVLKTDSKLTQVIGLNDDDKLLIFHQKNRVKVLTIAPKSSNSTIRLARANSRGIKFFKEGTKDIRIAALAPTDLLISLTGSTVDLKDLNNHADWFVVGTTNLVTTVKGIHILSREQTLKAIKIKGIKHENITVRKIN